jgi:hypothetical protein
MKYYWDDKVSEMNWARHIARLRKIRNAYKVLENFTTPKTSEYMEI